MHVTLDQDQWEVNTGATLGDVLADVSERAQGRSRIVTSLLLDQRAITDRDLDIGFLAESTSKFVRLTATSQSMQDIVEAARPSTQRYLQLLRTEGRSLVQAFRCGQAHVGTLDLWLGRLADYIELTEGGPRRRGEGDQAKPLSSWVAELLDARSSRDIVLMADLLEYEILPRLEA